MENILKGYFFNPKHKKITFIGLCFFYVFNIILEYSDLSVDWCGFILNPLCINPGLFFLRML